MNIEKSEKKAHKAFTRFLTQLSCPNTDYWYFDEPELDNYLAKFWLGVQKCDIDDTSDDEECDRKDG